MLFNSPIFLFLFLPLALGGFYLSARLGGRTAAIWFLLAASCAFYAYSSLFNFGLFIATVFANFMFGAMIATVSPTPMPICASAEASCRQRA